MRVDADGQKMRTKTALEYFSASVAYLFIRKPEIDSLTTTVQRERKNLVQFTYWASRRRLFGLGGRQSLQVLGQYSGLTSGVHCSGDDQDNHIEALACYKLFVM